MEEGEYEVGSGDSNEGDGPELVNFFDLMGNNPSSADTSPIGSSSSMSETFDEDLPAVHSYLGKDMEEVSGRVIYTENAVVNLPLLAGQCPSLLPGQTFPLTIRDRERLEMMKACLAKDHTFACVSMIQDEGPIYGTTAEIYEYAIAETGGITLKAKGRQRFRISKHHSNRIRVRTNTRTVFIAGYCKTVDCYILPEVKLSHPFTALNYSSLNSLRVGAKEKCRKIESHLTPWPKWLYDMYDAKKLVKKANNISFLKQGLRKEKGHVLKMPEDPTELSFWIASHLDAKKRLFILKLDSPIPRLRWLISYLSKNQLFVCSTCEATIGKQSDIFAMSIEGAQSTYVNSEGYHHDTVTLRKADNIIPVSPPSTHFSWFPGYAWSIAVCRNCQHHLGWRFSTKKANVYPRHFWGLTRGSLDTKIEETQDPDNMPVM